MRTKIVRTKSISEIRNFEILYQKIYDKMDQETGEYLGNTWKRYLDDCFNLWTKPKEEKFHNFLNMEKPQTYNVLRNKVTVLFHVIKPQTQFNKATDTPKSNF